MVNPVFSCPAEHALRHKTVLYIVAPSWLRLVAIFVILYILVIIVVKTTAKYLIFMKSKQIVSHTVLVEHSADYGLGMDTKYYNFVPDEGDQPNPEPPPVQPIPLPPMNTKEKELNADVYTQ